MSSTLWEGTGSVANRDLVVHIIGDTRSYDRALKSAATSTQRFEGRITGIGRSLRGAFAAAGVTIGALAVADQLRKTVSAASDLNEEINKTSVVFGESSQAVLAWSRTTASALGLSQRAALQAAAGFGQILETSGLTEQQAASFSRRLVGLSADIASFNNIDPSEALDKLRAGLVGEAEPLRRVGVLLSEARVKQEAYRLGIARTGDELTEGQKVQARYSLILRDTAKTQGDFSRTSDSLANAQRRLSAGLENIRASIGSAVLPAIAAVTSKFADFLTDLGEARTVRAKLRVVFQGLESIGRDILNTVLTTLRNTDWEAVGRQVGRFVADSLSTVAEAIRRVNWADVGSAIVRGIGDFLRNVNWKALAVSTLKLLVAAFRANVSFLVGVGKEMGRQLVTAIGVGLDNAKDFVIRKLLEFVNRILGVTSFLGRFDPFAGLRDKVRAQLEAMEGDAAKSTSAIQKSIDDVHGKKIEIEIGVKSTAANRPGKQVGAGLIPDVLATFDLIDQQFRAAETKVKALTAKAVALKTQADALQAARDRFAEAFGRAELAADKAALTRTLKDDIEQTRVQEALVLQQIKIEGHTLELDRRLFEIRSKRAELRAEQEQRARAGTQAAQFRALGLTAEGGDKVPTVENLRKQLQQVAERIAGTPLDTKKLRDKLKQIRAVLSGEFGKATEETRRKIKELLDAIRGGFDDIGEGPLTKTSGFNTKKILEGLGLDAATAAELRSRLSGFNTAGVALAGGTVPTSSTAGGSFGQPIVLESTTNLIVDGEVIARAVTRAQQKSARRNPKQKRGPNRVGGV